MDNAETPERTLTRSEKRQISGVHLALVWGGVLIILLIIYLAAHGITAHFSNVSWARAINRALEQRNAEDVSALLIACKREAPRLAESPAFAVWQNRLLQIQQENAAKHAVFQRKLSELEKLLKNPAGNKQAPELLLADAARYAVDSADLVKLRDLQLHCEALARTRELAASQEGVKELRALNENLKKLIQLRQENRWQEYRTLLRQTAGSAAGLLIKYQALPEISAQILKLRKAVDSETLQGNAAEQLFNDQERDFKKIVSEIDARLIEFKAQEFLKKYPQSRYSGEVRMLLNELNVLKKDFSGSIEKNIAGLEKNIAGAKKFFASEVEKIIGSELARESYELLVRTEQGDVLSFVTRHRTSFSKADSDGRCKIKFQDDAGISVEGVFTQDGKGRIATDNGIFICSMIHGKPGGTLPESYKQTMLFRISSMLMTGQDEDFPVMLYVLTDELDRNLLTGSVRQKLSESIEKTEKILKIRVGQFVFERGALKQILRYQPVFAGLVRLNGKDGIEYLPAGLTHTNSTLWRINSASDRGQFLLLGAMRGHQIDVRNRKLLEDKHWHVLAVPEENADVYATLKKLQDIAKLEKQFSKLPELPDFLQLDQK